MPHDRLTTALEQGLFVLPEGPVAVLRPPAGFDLSAFSGRDVTISHGHRPAYDAWQAAGYRVAMQPGLSAVALVVLPRERELGRAMVAQAADCAPLVLIDGQKTDGVDSLWRALRDLLGEVPSLTQAHGRLMWIRPGHALAGWLSPPPAPGADGLIRQAGVFSADGPDPGSVLLARHLPAQLPARMADLGAGWGYLSRAVLDRPGVTSLDVIEAEALALDCAKANLPDPRVAFHWADATRFDPRAPWDGVVMNPPFHQGRAAEPALGQAFIAAAARGLAPQGQLWLVANRRLPYEAALAAAFKEIRPLADEAGYKVIHASRPRHTGATRGPRR